MSAGKQLLVIDDEPDFADIVRSVGEQLGFAVTLASNADDFKRCYADLAPAAIVLDMVMPGTDGIQLVGWLAGNGCAALVVVVSGFNPLYTKAAKAIAEAKAPMRVETLQKPVKLDDLRAVLLSAL
jgi:DNA-binding NtrC family response regulator